MRERLSEQPGEVPSSTSRPLIHLAIALAAECVYLIGRAFILPVFESDVARELAITSWRVPFVLLYAWLFFVGMGGKATEKRGVPSHLLLWGAVFLAFVAGPPAWGPPPPFDLSDSVFLLTAPIVAMREELFLRAILQNALERAIHPLLAVLATVLLFVGFHVGMQPMNAYTVSALAALGLLCGVIYQRTHSLWLVVLVHTAYDCLPQLPQLGSFAPTMVLLGNVMAFLAGIIWWFLDKEKEVQHRD